MTLNTSRLLRMRLLDSKKLRCVCIHAGVHMGIVVCSMYMTYNGTTNKVVYVHMYLCVHTYAHMFVCVCIKLCMSGHLYVALSMYTRTHTHLVKYLYIKKHQVVNDINIRFISHYSGPNRLTSPCARIDTHDSQRDILTSLTKTLNISCVA